MQVADELERLGRLSADGTISDDVFARAKAALLDGRAQAGLADELQKLAGLRARGVISGEELARQELALLGPAPAPTALLKDKKADPPTWAKGCGCLSLIVIGMAILLAIFGPDSKKAAPGSSTAQPASTPAAAANTSDAAEPTPAPTPAGPEAITVTAAELFNAYQANEAAAQRRYGAGPLLVSGTVNGVELDMFDKPSIKLRTPNEFLDADADLTSAGQSRADKLRKGQKVVLLCESVSEVMGIPMLKQCGIQ